MSFRKQKAHVSMSWKPVCSLQWKPGDRISGRRNNDSWLTERSSSAEKDFLRWQCATVDQVILRNCGQTRCLDRLFRRSLPQRYTSYTWIWPYPDWKWMGLKVVSHSGGWRTMVPRQHNGLRSQPTTSKTQWRTFRKVLLCWYEFKNFGWRTRKWRENG